MHFMRKFDPEKFMKTLRKGGVSRREFNAAALTAGLVATAIPFKDGHAVTGQMPVYFTWSGYEIPELHQPFIDKYGRSPDYSVFAGEEEALSKMRAGYTPDILHPCVEATRKWMDAGILAPIDISRVQHWDDIYPELQHTEGVWYDGECRFVPTDWGNSSIIYRTDIYEGEETWGMLFDERYKGRIGGRNTSAMVWAAAQYLGFDMWNPTDEQLYGPIADLLRKQRDLVRFYWDDQTSMEQGIASGELVVAYAWNEALVHLLDQGIPVAYANPKEGIWTWLCGLSLTVGRQADEQMCYDFIDAWLAPETGKYLTEAYGYGHGNKNSIKLVDPAITDRLGISDPSSLFANGIFFRPIDPELDEKYVKLFEEILAGF